MTKSDENNECNEQLFLQTRIIAQNLINQRYLKGFTQRKLSQISKVPQSTIGDAEAGNLNLSLRTLVKLSDALKISTESLFQEQQYDWEHLKANQLRHFLRANDLVLISDLFRSKNKKFEFKRIEMKANSNLKMTKEKSSRKYIFIEEGCVNIRKPGLNLRLEKGDFFHFYAEENHEIYNLNSQKAVLFQFMLSE
jgi:transcriptional regulator with XRE-family HTH domain